MTRNSPMSTGDSSVGPDVVTRVGGPQWDAGGQSDIRLVLADVDGTLVPKDKVLTEAATNQAGTQLALAHRLGIDRTVMTYLIDDLERAGLVSRQPDPADRRARRIVATEHGRSRLTSLDQRLRQAEEHVLAVLDRADRETLRDLLRRVATQASALDPANPCQVVAEVAQRGQGRLPGQGLALAAEQFAVAGEVLQVDHRASSTWYRPERPPALRSSRTQSICMPRSIALHMS